MVYVSANAKAVSLNLHRYTTEAALGEVCDAVREAYATWRAAGGGGALGGAVQVESSCDT
jgi:hypothetical protein